MENGFFYLENGSKSTDEKVAEPKSKNNRQSFSESRQLTKAMEAIAKYGEDTVLPKKPTSSYQIYETQNLKTIMNSFNYSNNRDGIKKAGEIWSVMTSEEKEPYEILASQQKQKYESQYSLLMK